LGNVNRNFYEGLWEQVIADPGINIGWFRKAHASSLARQVVSFTANAKDDRLVDIGCGSAMYAAHISRLNHSAFMGIDISSSILQASGRKFTVLEQASCLGLVQGDAAQLPLASNTFDLIICAHTLEHLPDDGATIAEFQRIIRRGGYVWIVVPNPVKDMLNIFRPLQKRLDKLGHLREYSAHDMVELLSSHGFEVQRVYCSEFILHWLLFSVEEHLRPLNRRLGLISRFAPASKASSFITFILDRWLFWESRLFRKRSWGMSRCYIARCLNQID
jgi:ubiquinone/menaquinone biosynthesis C-methylase UbiE